MIECEKVDTFHGKVLQVRVRNPWRWLRGVAARRRIALGDWWRPKREWRRAKVDELITALFTRAIRIPAVQEEVAYQLGGNTPLCRVLRDTIASYVDHNQPEIGAEDVVGLEKFIEDMIEDIDVEAHEVSGLEKFIEDVIEATDIDADKIDHLENAVKEVIDEHGVHSSKVEQLDIAVHEIVDAALQDGELAETVVQLIAAKLRK